MRLTYKSAGESKAKRPNFAAIASCILLLLGVSYAFPSVRNFARQAYHTLAGSILHSSPDFSAPAGPASSPASELNWPAYDPDAPVITAVPRTGQSIKELSHLYIGRFDAQLYQQIYKLNPQVKDFDYLQAVPLIRLPLPMGTSPAEAGAAHLAQTAPPGTWKLAISMVKSLFSSTNR